VWLDYTRDLVDLLGMMRQDRRREARGQLAKRVGTVFQALSGAPAPLYTIDIEIDNDISDRYTVLHIDAPDTIGFLYEFTNALAFTRTYIARMIVRRRDSAPATRCTSPARMGKRSSPGRQQCAAVVLIKHFTPPADPQPTACRWGIYQLASSRNWPDEITRSNDRRSQRWRVLGVSRFLWDDSAYAV
jgi:glutamate-ammonia-ligase adenylyltransferase